MKNINSLARAPFLARILQRQEQEQILTTLAVTDGEATYKNGNEQISDAATMA